MKCSYLSCHLLLAEASIPVYLQLCTCTTMGKIARLFDCINAVPSTIAQLEVGACLYLLPRRLQTLFCKVN
jgi:hypothetical protein